MYPGAGLSVIMTDIVSAGLDELEAAMPYVQGERIIGEDEIWRPRIRGHRPFTAVSPTHARPHRRSAHRGQPAPLTAKTAKK